ncbi:MAG: T9SS type A sorting domain-containing protein [Bacteroidetes bacterium]|nr:T9SS type A sorting domain-containing protein [Bacteroidota bacterium]
MKNFLSIAALLLFTQAGISQNNKTKQFAYIFSADSLAGFDEVAAKNSAISEGFLGDEFKVRMWGLKRSFINSKYGITPKTHKYKNSSYNLRPAVAAVCVNEDFETSAPGVITTPNQIGGWTLSGGSNQFPGNSCNITTPNLPSESELIATTNGYIDPVIGGVYPIYSVFGTIANTGTSVNPGIQNMYGDRVIRINNNINDYSIEKLSKTILVTSSNALFQFAFLSVFSTGHTCCDAGAFQINLTNATTSAPITCPNFSVSAPSVSCPSGTDAPQYYNAPSGTPYTGTGSIIFNKWRMSSIDLSAYIGQNITIDIVATDCDAGGHYGYSYFDSQCSPMTISNNNTAVSAANSSIVFPTCGATTFSIVAPPGQGPYSWSGVSVGPPYTTPSFSNQTFTTNFAGTYTLTMTPIGSCFPVTKVITLSVTPSASPLSLSGNTVICATAGASLTVSGASTYTWSNGSNASSVVLNPAITTNYNVSGTDINNCIATTSLTILVGAVNVTINGANIVCIGSSSTFTLGGAASYSLNATACANTINILPLANTTYTISGSNSPSCVNTQTFNVYVNTSCADVWPGDANSDGSANNLDILELGLHLSQTGAARASISNLWQSYFANNWVGFISNGKNLSHSDCNGSGLIDLNDTLAIYNNYNLTHTFKNNTTTFTSPQLNVVPDQNFVQSGQWGTASIYLGDSTNTINTINGVAFTINFDKTYLQFDSVYIEYPISFLNATNQNLHFRKKQFNNGIIYTATTHTNNTNVSGNGKIAVLHFKVNPGLVFDTLFNFNLMNANQSNANGIISPLTVGATNTVAIGNTVGIKENYLENTISIFPNPASDVITIKSSEEIKKIEVLNLTGQIFLTEMVKSNTKQLNLGTFAKGIYLVKIYTVNGEVAIKKVVTK